jgi:hypothetical protein
MKKFMALALPLALSACATPGYYGNYGNYGYGNYGYGGGSVYGYPNGYYDDGYYGNSYYGGYGGAYPYSYGYAAPVYPYAYGRYYDPYFNNYPRYRYQRGWVPPGRRLPNQNQAGNPPPRPVNPAVPSNLPPRTQIQQALQQQTAERALNPTPPAHRDVFQIPPPPTSSVATAPRAATSYEMIQGGMAQSRQPTMSAARPSFSAPSAPAMRSMAPSSSIGSMPSGASSSQMIRGAMRGARRR